MLILRLTNTIVTGKLHGYSCWVARRLLALDDIPVFDLGGRTVSWTPVSGHTPGSVIFLDEQNHCVFDGDAATPGVWLFLPESLPVQSYVNSITSYVDYLKQNHVRFRYGAIWQSR